jgi:hypothetical protein
MPIVDELIYELDEQIFEEAEAVVEPGLFDYPTIQAVLDATVKRSGVYYEAAPRNPQVSTFANSPLAWATPRKEQLVREYFGPGITNVTNVSVCRTGDMRQAVAVSASDGAEYGTGESEVVVVRTQSDAEGYGPAVVAHQGTDLIRDVALISAYNPLLFANPLAREENYLVLMVWYGADPNSKCALYVSADRGRSWAKVWESTTGRIRTPRLVQDTTGATYLFFRDSNDDTLKFYTVQDAPSLWGATLSWDNPTATSMWVLGGRPFDIRSDRAMWVFASGATNATEVRYSLDPDPGYLAGWITQTDTGIPGAAPEWVRVARAGGLDPFGNWPTDTVLVVQGSPIISPASYYRRYIASVTGGTITPVEGGGYKPLPRHTGVWQHAQIDGAGFRFVGGDTSRIVGGQTVNALTNSHKWNRRLTPSTYITQGNDPGGIGSYVYFDTRGPLVGDTDSVDTFPLFWTKSGPNFSAAFPPYTVGVDMEAYFKIQFQNPQYHNVWFVIADPLYPERPLFKADYYVGSATDPGGTHPHDNARGLAMWFGAVTNERHPQKTAQDAPRGTFCEPYRHPLPYLFQGYDDPADNQRVWDFKLVYVASTDEFELYWQPTVGGGYVPFVPYAGHGLGNREFVDVGPNGTVDEYVASSTERYWRVPRAGLWPRQIVVGCPEVKPAFEMQSGIRVGEISVSQPVSVPTIAPAGLPCLIPRMSGSIDLFYVESDALFRQTAGHGFSDLMGVESFRSSHAMDAGPDQAQLTVLAVDNYRAGRAVDNLHDHHLCAYAVGGYRSREGAPGYEAGGAWADWRCIFFGTSDTSSEQDGQDTPRISAAFYSPLRELARHHGTQGFSNMEPIEATDDDTGEPTGVEDEVAVRQTAVIFMTDFTEPCNQSLPVDDKGRLMRYEDYITRFLWEDMLRLDPARLEVERVGFQPTTFTINSSSGDANLLDSVRPLWESLGLHWWYDFSPDDFETASRVGGGVFRVWRGGSNINFDPNRTPDLTLRGRTSLALPLGLPTSDFGRAGNVVTTVSNLESRPNHAVARPAPWPDGADTIEVGVEWQNGRPSQHAFNDMYQFGMPQNLLRREWASARMLQVPVHAAPYFRPGLLVEVDIEVDQPPNVSARFTHVEGRYFVWGCDHEVSPDSLSASVLLRPVEEFEL